MANNDIMEKKERNKIPEKILFFLILLLSFSFCIVQIYDYDFWWHLKTGEHICKTLSVPHRDFFSLATEGKEWINPHWLSQVLFYAVFLISGFSGIQILVAFIIAWIIYIIFKTEKKRTNAYFVLPLLYLAIYSSKDRFTARPDIFTLFFSVLFFYILHRFTFHDEKKIFLLPFLQILWVNMHGSFILGSLIIFSFFMGTLAEWILARFTKIQKAESENDLLSKTIRINTLKSKCLILLAILLITLCASFVNPYGGKIYSLYLPFLDSFKQFLSASRADSPPITIQEWLPTFSSGAAKYRHTFFHYYILLSLICFNSFILNTRKFSASLLFTFAGFFLLSVSALRNIAPFSLIAALIAIHNLSEFFSYTQLKTHYLKIAKSRQLLRAAFFIFLILLLSSIYDVFSNNYYVRHSLPNATGFGIDRFYFPAGAAHFVKETRPEGTMYNDFESGGFLMWSLYPEYMVFIDGRFTLAAPDRVQTGVDKDFRKWQELADEYKTHFAILKFPLPGTTNLISQLIESDTWKVVFIDSNSIMFMRESEINRKIIENYEIRFPPFTERLHAKMNESHFNRNSFDTKAYENFYVHPIDIMFQQVQKSIEKIQKKPIPVDVLNRGFFLHLSGFLYASMEQYSSVLLQNADYLPAHYELGLLNMQMEKYDKAFHEMKYLLDHGMTTFEVFYYAGFSAFRLGNYYEAVELLNNALIINNKHYQTCFFLSLSNIKIGNFDEAEMYMKQAIKIEPNSSNAHFNLGSIFLLKKENNKAKEEFERVLQIDPFYRKAEEELKKLN
ncbi:MAG: hypothetical protein A2Y62_06695 [Candidatus Fischerbacteria bacterium RBG_13_37_8]|uniref:Uncharacterized protein n=1 Tax=Candidatus Fischerbacteria bacterium RBG_13_37_8 TaxID=1817863 RepID=A0A1F5VM71_9BACT|nr:MAG: hypothetical protein A2Y62_06695 [Candidatus Fischerbacteria bacterium RBG_13_37_8]